MIIFGQCKFLNNDIIAFNLIINSNLSKKNNKMIILLSNFIKNL